MVMKNTTRGPSPNSIVAMGERVQDACRIDYLMKICTRVTMAKEETGIIGKSASTITTAVLVPLPLGLSVMLLLLLLLLLLLGVQLAAIAERQRVRVSMRDATSFNT
jgi:hypothetical protein